MQASLLGFYLLCVIQNPVEDPVFHWPGLVA